MNDIIRVAGLPEVITNVPRNLDQNAAVVYLASLSAKTGRDTQRQVLEKMAAWLGGHIETIEWGSLRYAHVIALRTRIIDAGYKPASARKFLCALRGTLKAAWRLGQMNTDDYGRAIDIPPITGSSLPTGRVVAKDELERIFDACSRDGMIGSRDAALIALMYGCGLRRAEITSLDLDDYNADEGTLLIKGKRNKERRAFIHNGVKDALNDWIAKRGNEPGPLFWQVYKSGKARIGKRLTTQAILFVVYKRADEAGLERFSPHSLRKSFVSTLLDNGVDISTVSRLAGHASIKTTSIYDRRDERVQSDGSQLITVPYKKNATDEVSENSPIVILPGS